MQLSYRKKNKKKQQQQKKNKQTDTVYKYYETQKYSNISFISSDENSVVRTLLYK